MVYFYGKLKNWTVSGRTWQSSVHVCVIDDEVLAPFITKIKMGMGTKIGFMAAFEQGKILCDYKRSKLQTGKSQIVEGLTVPGIQLLLELCVSNKKGIRLRDVFNLVPSSSPLQLYLLMLFIAIIHHKRSAILRKCCIGERYDDLAELSTINWRAFLEKGIYVFRRIRSCWVKQRKQYKETESFH